MRCTGIFGTALDVNGPISISPQTISNLTAGAANFVSGGNVSGAVASANFANSATNATNATNASNSNSLGNVGESGWCRQMVTNSGTAIVSSHGLVYTSNVTGTQTRATGGRNLVIESVSDRKLKSEIQLEKLGIEFIRGLITRTFRMKSNPGVLQHGFIYDEVKQLISRDDDSLAYMNDSGLGGVDYNGLISPMVNATQNIDARLLQLESQFRRYMNA